ncbi:MAG: response regulator [Gemmatimonadota bacterium]|nr:response regulator [Gemmatimonadota bacterium]
MQKVSILVVEDQILVAENLREVLNSLGHEVCSIAVSGKKAIELAKKEKPGLVLMDIVLKGEMDGIEAAEQIRQHLDIPVVFCTAHSDAETLKRSKLAEPFGYIIKPLEGKELAATIEIALYKHRIDKEKNRLIKELNEALEKVKLLSGLLPICSACKQIQDEQGSWQRLELYIRDRSEADFSHSLCPECAKKLYPEYYKGDE